MAIVFTATAPSGAVARSDAFITKGYRRGFILVTSLFFLWAIANNFNDILIRQFQKALELDRAQVGLIQSVFYFGYFTTALPAGLIMRRFGYRSGILTGLALYAAGAVLFYPAAEIRTFAVFLTALYIIATGAAFLETAANPYIIAFGDSCRAAQRLNLAQAFNGVGAFIAPILGGLFIFSGIEHSKVTLAGMDDRQRAAYAASEALMVQTPYLVLAAVVTIVALLIAVTPLPDLDTETKTPAERPKLGSLLATPGLRGAVIAQFFYVGAQVGIWSYFIDFTKDVLPETPERIAAYCLSASLVLFMVGRFVGTALMVRIAATRLLLVYAAINVGLCGFAMVAGSYAAVAALGLTSFFMSIMYPTIFTLGIQDLGSRAKLGSSLIVMAIVGGAVFPPLMGLMATIFGTLKPALGLPMLCFAVVALYATRLLARR